MILDGDAQPAMRIGRFEYIPSPRHRDGLVGIEHSEGMMGEGRRRERARRHCGQADSLQVHRCLLERAAELSNAIYPSHPTRQIRTTLSSPVVTGEVLAKRAEGADGASDESLIAWMARTLTPVADRRS